MNSLVDGKFDLVVKIFITHGAFHLVFMYCFMPFQCEQAIKGFATLLANQSLMFSFQVFFQISSQLKFFFTHATFPGPKLPVIVGNEMSHERLSRHGHVTNGTIHWFSGKFLKVDSKVCCHFGIAFKPLAAVFTREPGAMYPYMFGQLNIITKLLLTDNTHVTFDVQLWALDAMYLLQMIHDIFSRFEI